MTPHDANTWEIYASMALIATLFAVGLWLLLRKGPTPEEREYARREFLARSGRLVDGMLLDICEVAPSGKDQSGSPLTMLVYSYRIGGVDYGSSQDITTMRDVVDVAQVRAGFPCSVRYQPGNPQNSIVVAEEWTGLREGLPVWPAFQDPEPIDLDTPRRSRG
jgi:hypothetical protein